MQNYSTKDLVTALYNHGPNYRRKKNKKKIKVPDALIYDLCDWWSTVLSSRNPDIKISPLSATRPVLVRA